MGGSHERAGVCESQEEEGTESWDCPEDLRGEAGGQGQNQPPEWELDR